MTVCNADQVRTPIQYSKIDARMTLLPVPVLFLVVLAAIGCSTKPAPSGTGARQAIEATVSRYVAASNRGDVDALMKMYVEDAVLMPPDHEPIQGREAIGAFWRQGTDQGLEVSTIRVDTDGRLGYMAGRYRLPATSDEPADSGKYLMCLERQADGSWKLTADMWNSSGDNASDDSPDVTEPRSVSRLGAPRSGGGTRATAPTGTDKGAPRAWALPA